MTGVDDEEADDPIRIAASDWWSTMRSEPTEDERRRFEAWRGQDRRHAEAYTRIERRWAQIEPTRLTRAAAGRTLARSSLTERHPLLVWGGITALAAAGLGVVAVETNLLGSGATLDATVRYAATTTSQAIRLADRSAVVLAPGASITATNSTDARLVRLDAGTGRFDVVHDSDRPFTVQTPNGSITVRGTLFSVTVAGRTTRVSLFQGSVVVRGLGVRSEPVVLRPGERAVVTRDQAPERVSDLDRATDATMVVLDGVPLRTAIERVSGTGARQLTVSHDVRADLKLTGAFRAGDVDGLARAAAALFKLRLTETGEGRLLLSPR